MVVGCVDGELGVVVGGVWVVGKGGGVVDLGVGLCLGWFCFGEGG